jgi:hypothetical protein
MQQLFRIDSQVVEAHHSWAKKEVIFSKDYIFIGIVCCFSTYKHNPKQLPTKQA